MRKKILISMGVIVFALAVAVNINTITGESSWTDIALSDVEALSQAECSMPNPYGGYCYEPDTRCCSSCAWCGCSFSGYSNDWCYYG